MKGKITQNPMRWCLALRSILPVKVEKVVKICPAVASV